MNTKNYIAIDTSKRTLQVSSPFFSGCFPFSDPGSKKLIQKIQSVDSPVAVYEASGGYERKRSEALREHSIAGCLVESHSHSGLCK